MTPDLQCGIHLIGQYDKPLGFKHTRQCLWICGQVLRTSPRPEGLIATPAAILK